MPTYTVHYSSHVLGAEMKHQLALEITNAHQRVTGAEGFFAQVLFQERAPQDCYLGGSPVQHPQFFVQGQIRAGRSSQVRRDLLVALRDVVMAVTGLTLSQVWVYLVELRPSDMMEYGHILPPPGEEKAWFSALGLTLQHQLLKKST